MKPTAGKIRSIIADCNTEYDIIQSLRMHKIKYGYTTETGILSIRIPCRTGTVRIYRSCSRSLPYRIHPAPGRNVVPVLPVDC